MAGIGILELLVIIVIGVVLFGAPLLTFFVGYAMGKSRATTHVTTPTTGATPAVPVEPPAPPASPTHAEEPVDE